MPCPECHGLGLVYRVGDYTTKNGAKHFKAVSVSRCPLYLKYFSELAEAGQHPKDAPVLTGSGLCDAAVKRHQEMRDSKPSPQFYRGRRREAL